MGQVGYELDAKRGCYVCLGCGEAIPEVKVVGATTKAEPLPHYVETCLARLRFRVQELEERWQSFGVTSAPRSPQAVQMEHWEVFEAAEIEHRLRHGFE